MAYQITIARGTKVPKVEQLFRGIRNDIEKGKLAAGVQLPSITDLAARISNSRDTV